MTFHTPPPAHAKTFAERSGDALSLLAVLGAALLTLTLILDQVAVCSRPSPDILLAPVAGAEV